MRAATNDRGVELSPGDTLVIATLLQQSIAINEALKEHGVDVVRRGDGKMVSTYPQAPEPAH